MEKTGAETIFVYFFIFIFINKCFCFFLYFSFSVFLVFRWIEMHAGKRDACIIALYV